MTRRRTQGTMGTYLSPDKRMRHQRKLWVRTFLVLATATAFMILGLLTSPPFLEWFQNLVDAIRWPFVSACQAVVPVSPDYLCSLAVTTYLAPELYAAAVLVIVAEKFAAADKTQPRLCAGTRHDFVMWFIMNGPLKAAAGLAVLMFVGWLYEGFLSGLSFSFTEQWSNPQRVVAGLILTDLLDWFSHYVKHRVPVLWRFHAVHHSQPQMNLFTDYRNHFVEYLVAKPMILIPLLMLNLPVEYAIGVVVFKRLYTLIYHGNLKTDYGLLRYVLVTPQSHRIHHSCVEQHQDKNFGVILSVWDRLFGTHCADDGEYPAVGLQDADFPVEHPGGLRQSFSFFVRQNLYPFKQVLPFLVNARAIRSANNRD